MIFQVSLMFMWTLFSSFADRGEAANCYSCGPASLGVFAKECESTVSSATPTQQCDGSCVTVALDLFTFEDGPVYARSCENACSNIEFNGAGVDIKMFCCTGDKCNKQDISVPIPKPPSKKVNCYSCTVCAEPPDEDTPILSCDGQCMKVTELETDISVRGCMSTCDPTVFKPLLAMANSYVKKIGGSQQAIEIKYSCCDQDSCTGSKDTTLRFDPKTGLHQLGI